MPDLTITDESPYTRVQGEITVRGTAEAGKKVTVTLTHKPEGLEVPMAVSNKGITRCSIQSRVDCQTCGGVR